jgi:hypothetical protein
MASKFCWYELMTNNTAAAETFYREIVGWSASDAGMPNMSYTLLSVGDTPVAGLMSFPPEVPQGQGRPAWLGYIQVDDADAAAAAAEKLGAKILHAPADIPDVGRFAVLSDPQGVCFALFKPMGARPTVPPMTPGTIAWHELHTKDAEKALNFYGALFGWKLIQAMDMGPMGAYHIFGDESMPMGMGGMFNDPNAPQPYWLYYFAVADIDAAMARVTASGGSVQIGPREVPGGAWIIQATDPQGANFALVGMRSEAAA